MQQNDNALTDRIAIIVMFREIVLSGNQQVSTSMELGRFSTTNERFRAFCKEEMERNAEESKALYKQQTDQFQVEIERLHEENKRCRTLELERTKEVKALCELHTDQLRMTMDFQVEIKLLHKKNEEMEENTNRMRMDFRVEIERLHAKNKRFRDTYIREIEQESLSPAIEQRTTDIENDVFYLRRQLLSLQLSYARDTIQRDQEQIVEAKEANLQSLHQKLLERADQSHADQEQIVEEKEANLHQADQSHAYANRTAIVQQNHPKCKHWKNTIHRQNEQYYLQRVNYEIEPIANCQLYRAEELTAEPSMFFKKPFSKSVNT